MSKKKNKAANTPSAKAARNMEALKKAKAAVTATEQTVTEEKKEAPVEKPVEQPVQKVEEPKTTEPTKPTEEKKETSSPYKTPSGKSAYETHTKCCASPFMSPISRSLFTDDHGVEQIKETWKNTNNNETVTLCFPISNIKSDDKMYPKTDLDKLRNETNSKETTKTAKKEEKPKKTEKKVKTVEVEEVTDAEIINSAPTVQIPEQKSSTVLPNNPTDRIDANRSVDLMSALIRRRDEIKDNPELTELYKASGKQADVMLWTLLTKWNAQWKNDAEAAGIRINKEMFGYLQDSVSTLLGVKLIGNTISDGQLSIDFNATVKQTSPAIQTALKQEAAVVPVKEPEKIPTTEECTTDDDKLNALRTIMNARRNGKGTMGTNLLNAIEFAKKAYSLDDKASPATVLATILDKFGEKKQESVLLNCMSTAVMGNLMSNLTPVSPHAWLKTQMPDLPDKDLADLMMVFLTKKIGDDNEDVKQAEIASKNLTTFLHNSNDDLINRIVDSAKANGKNDSKLVVSKVNGVTTTSSFISSIKVINSIKAAYGTSLSDKLLKTQMKQIVGLYANRDITPLSNYVEKAYKK